LRIDVSGLAVVPGFIDIHSHAVRSDPADGIFRWPDAMPQYHVGHVELVEGIESAVAGLPGLELAGNAYHGVGIPNCIHSGEGAAERVLDRSGRS
jgi:oxygen-dependent protoporphyrinogen oxidase